jgi:integrase
VLTEERHMASYQKLTKKDPNTGISQEVIDAATRRVKCRVRARLIDSSGQRRSYEEVVVGVDAARERAAELTEIERKQLAERQGGAPADTSGGTALTVAIARWLPEYRDTLLNPATFKQAVAEVRTWIEPELLRLGVETTGDLTLAHLEHLRDRRPRFDGRDSKPSVATRNKTVAILQAMTRDFTKYGYITRNLSAGKEGLNALSSPRKRRARIPVVDDLEGACQSLDAEYGDSSTDYTPSDIVMGVALAALRVSEGLGVAPEDVQPARHLLNVHRSRLRNGSERCDQNPDELAGRGKTKGAFREVTMDRMTQEHLLRMGRFSVPMPCGCCGRPTGGRLACEPDGTPISYDRLKNMWTRACQLAAVKPIALGELRHFGVSRAIKAGVSPYLVMRFAGHTKLETTLNEYADLWPNDHAEMSGLLDALGLGR